MSPGDIIHGRRLADTTWPDALPVSFDDMRDGDYWFVKDAPQHNDGFKGSWMLYFHGVAGISKHHVIEHDDGTISVPQPGAGEPANSVLIAAHGNCPGWHGYIEHGAWREI